MKTALLVFLAFAASLLCAEEFTPPDGLKLRAAFPADTKVARYVTSSPDGDVNHTVLSYDRDGVRFALIIDAQPPSTARRNVEQAYEMAKQAVLSKHGVKLVRDEPVTAGAFRGRRFVFEETGKSRVEQRLFATGDSMYTFAVGAPWSADFAAASGDFFLSIR